MTSTGCRRLLPLILVLLLPLACADDDPSCPDPDSEFEIVLHCVDDAGEPLANVVVGAMPALPAGIWPWGPDFDAAARKSRVNLRFDLADTCQVRLIVRDVEHQIVSRVYEGGRAAGSHVMSWNGNVGDSYATAPPGYYEAVLLLHDAGSWTAIDSVAMLHVAFDPGHYTVGITDATGTLRITDRRLFPAFFELMPLQHVGEDGYEHGEFAITAQTWLLCGTHEGQYEWAEIEAVDGESQEMTVVFGDPVPELRPRATAAGPASPRKDPRGSLAPPLPNPFN